jgi:hypothetical protein
MEYLNALLMYLVWPLVIFFGWKFTFHNIMKFEKQHADASDIQVKQ